jgi:hypothetical protein
MNVISDFELLKLIEENHLTILPIFFDPEGFGKGALSHWEISSPNFTFVNKNLKAALFDAYVKFYDNTTG